MGLCLNGKHPRALASQGYKTPDSASQFLIVRTRVRLEIAAVNGTTVLSAKVGEGWALPIVAPR